MKPVFALLIFFLLSFPSVWAQGEVCANIEPFCAGGEEFVFANTYNENGPPIEAEIGPYYGDLTTQRNPSWYFLQVQESGRLEFLISQTQNQDGSGGILDVDYAVWGAFSPKDDICDYDMLSEENLVNSSYEPDSTERMDLGETEAGEIYVVLITNHSNKNGFIKLEQVNAGQPGAGLTDCFQGGLEDEIYGCEGETVIVDGTVLFADEYTWFVEKNGSFEEMVGETDAYLEVEEEGNYKLIVSNRFSEVIEDTVFVEFNPEPVANEPGELYICDDSQEFIDLTGLNPEITAGNPPSEILEVIYYESEEQLEEDEAIANPGNYTKLETHEIIALIRSESGCLSDPVKVSIKVEVIPEEVLAETIILCADLQGNILEDIELGEDLGHNYGYEWFLGEQQVSTQPILVLDEIPLTDELRLKITDIKGNCSRSFQSEILVFSAPERLEFEIQGNDFQEGYTVTAEAIPGISPDAVYEFQLDNGPWQESNVFKNVPPGRHNITAREINGCGATTSLYFDLVGYPRFFTPNSDGFNDSWKIDGDEDIQVLKLFIFDRYGKLIKQLNPNGAGWDGSFGGRDLPANDYWFKLEYLDRNTGKTNIFKSHFTLKR
ncbi:T9SS type B sorting domain-containing protein [Salegentibacter sediminis]|uniref:T9SS type B sorting domain-containing protein n=1 Tax=Salegentibacter sediminis TaxID=1930251 RepID=UPI0009BE2F63|nr:T9SS type B sorting domain-containing protein [Salegentibacter sediminis]